MFGRAVGPKLRRLRRCSGKVHVRADSENSRGSRNIGMPKKLLHVTNRLSKVGLLVQSCWTRCNKTNNFPCPQSHAVIRILPDNDCPFDAVASGDLSIALRAVLPDQAHAAALRPVCGDRVRIKVRLGVDLTDRL